MTLDGADHGARVEHGAWIEAGAEVEVVGVEFGELVVRAVPRQEAHDAA